MILIDKNYETRKSVKTKNNLTIFQIAPCTWHMWAGNFDQDFNDGKNYQWNCQNAVDFWEKICQKIRVSSKWNLEKHILTIFQNPQSRHLFFSYRNIYEVPMCNKNLYFYYETTIKSVLCFILVLTATHNSSILFKGFRTLFTTI